MLTSPHQPTEMTLRAVEEYCSLVCALTPRDGCVLIILDSERHAMCHEMSQSTSGFKGLNGMLNALDAKCAAAGNAVQPVTIGPFGAFHLQPNKCQKTSPPVTPFQEGETMQSEIYSDAEFAESNGLFDTFLESSLSVDQDSKNGDIFPEVQNCQRRQTSSDDQNVDSPTSPFVWRTGCENRLRPPLPTQGPDALLALHTLGTPMSSAPSIPGNISDKIGDGLSLTVRQNVHCLLDRYLMSSSSGTITPMYRIKTP